MRIIFISIVSLILSLDLFARANPFEPTDTFNQIQQQYLEKIKEQELLRKILEKQRQDEEAKKLAQTQEKLAEEKNLVEEQEVVQVEEERVVIPPKIEETKAIAQPIIKPVIKEIVYNNYDILPFVTANISDDTLNIKVDKKYKLLNQDMNPKEKKFVFDFKGKVNIYTKRKSFDNPSFTSITVGSHKEKNFFRIVVVLKDDIQSYQESINNKDSIVTIKKIK